MPGRSNGRLCVSAAPPAFGVTLDEARAFVNEHKRVVIATLRSDGTPALSPVSAVVDDDGYVVVSTRETAMKAKNLERDPRVELCVLSDTFFGDWIQLDGTAEIVRLPDALELLVEYYRAVAGEHSDWDDYRSAMQRERRVLVRIHVERAGPDRSG